MTALTVADTGLDHLIYTRRQVEQERAEHRARLAQSIATTRVEVAVGSAKEAMHAARRAANTVSANAGAADPTLFELREIVGLADAFQAIADTLRAAAPVVTPNLTQAA